MDKYIKKYKRRKYHGVGLLVGEVVGINLLIMLVLFLLFIKTSFVWELLVITELVTIPNSITLVVTRNRKRDTSKW